MTWRVSSAVTVDGSGCVWAGCETPAVSEVTIVSAGQSLLPAAPPDWQLVATEGPGPFVTRAAYRRPDGVEVEWTSRRHRKGQGLRLLRVPPNAPAPALGRMRVPRRTWWISGLFAVGSICFAVGALPAYLDAVSARADGLTFFVGSIFFTCASYLSFVEAANSPGAIQAGPVHHLPFRAGRLAAAVDRLVGHGDPAGRHPLLQRDDVSGPARQFGRSARRTGSCGVPT